MTFFDDVGSFHGKFNIDSTPHPLFHKQAIERGETPEPHIELAEGVLEFRLKFIEEEFRELQDAYVAGDLEQVADALADLTYVVLGLAHMHHLPFNEIWNEVQVSNMKKVRVESAADSKRGHSFDVKKPEGWKPPNIKAILKKYEKK